MEKNSRIYVAGHRGLVGSAIIRRLFMDSYTNVITRTRQQLDLTDQLAVNEFFNLERPDYVFLAAALVGGIQANNTRRGEFFYQNMQIQLNVIDAARKTRAKKLIYLGSNCIYPKLCSQPMKEEYLLTGLVEPTNEPYAIAKIVGIKMCESYNRQYGTNFIAAMPASIYGPGDHFDEQAHVLGSLIRKFHEAKVSGHSTVTLWGTGSPLREFIYADDAVDGIMYLMENFNPGNEDNELGRIFINLGSGTELSIKDLAQIIADIIGFRGNVKWDTSKPDGISRKLLDNTRMSELGWQPKTMFSEGLRKTYEAYITLIGQNT